VHVSRYVPGQLGLDLGRDIQVVLGDVTRPVVFDVGANIGQSILTFKGLLPRCVVHSFEPSPAVFRRLEDYTRGVRNVRKVNTAVGAENGEILLLENEDSELSSVLRPGTPGWGSIVRETHVEMITLDAYCATNIVERVDLLKIDTQGNDLAVLMGSRDLLAAGRIGAVLIEVIFTHWYDGAPTFDEIYMFLVDRGFRLVSLYNCQTYEGAMRWADVLFVRSPS
jgi:FkbM family methyltransferase